MSKITNDGLTRSGTRWFAAVPIWQQWASKGLSCWAHVTVRLILKGRSHRMHRCNVLHNAAMKHKLGVSLSTVTYIPVHRTRAYSTRAASWSRDLGCIPSSCSPVARQIWSPVRATSDQMDYTVVAVHSIDTITHAYMDKFIYCAMLPLPFKTTPNILGL